MRPTSESIMKSFQSSGKKHIVITGSIAHGKTSLKNELLCLLGSDKEVFSGITTYLVPGKGVMLRDNLSLKETLIGEFREDTMKPIPEGFGTLGVKALTEAEACKQQWIVIDEIGFLESKEVAFQDAVRNIFDKKHVLCVVRKGELPFLNELRSRPDVYLIDMDETYQKVGCVVMASGQGRRFGSNKLLAEFKGKPLYQRTFDLISSRLFDEIVVVTRTKEIYEEAVAKGFQSVLHNLTDRNDVVRLGIEQMKEMDACVFCPCDQPLLKRKSLEKLVNAFCKKQNKILRLAWKERPGTPVLFAKECFEELANLPAKKGGSYLIERYKDEVAFVQVTDEIELKDIDTKEELEVVMSYAETTKCK